MLTEKVQEFADRIDAEACLADDDLGQVVRDLREFVPLPVYTGAAAHFWHAPAYQLHKPC